MWFPSSTLPLAALMWFAMMAAMMLPTSAPWVRVLASLTERGGRVRSGALFLAGYLGVWLLFSVAAAVVQVGLTDALFLPGRDSPVSGLFLVGAGIYQLSPVKAACLRHCRNPLTYFLTRWRNGPRGALDMGWAHGLYCLGCCWALMSLALVLGVMDLLWMAVLAAAVFVENVAPGGAVIGRVAGVALVAWGVVVWAAG